MNLSLVFADSVVVASEIAAFYEEDIKQNEIDEIFTELNQMAMAEQFGEFLDVDRNTSLALTKDTRRTELDARLEELGVNKIDPNNEEEMAFFLEVVGGSTEESAESASNVPPPPDLAALANCYSLYQYEGTYNVDGTTYPFSYIRVVDDKGYAGTQLTQGKNEAHPIETNWISQTGSILVRDLLNYNFSFGLSAFLGSFANGWAVDWTIGTLSTVFGSISNPNTTYATNALYTATWFSITQMTYYYVYDGGWNLAGSKASNVEIGRSEALFANVGGDVESDTIDYPEKNFRANGAWSWNEYVQAYVRTGTVRYDSLGTLTMNGLGSTTTFTPCFAPTPTALI